MDTALRRTPNEPKRGRCGNRTVRREAPGPGGFGLFHDTTQGEDPGAPWSNVEILCPSLALAEKGKAEGQRDWQPTSVETRCAGESCDMRLLSDCVRNLTTQACNIAWEIVREDDYGCFELCAQLQHEIMISLAPLLVNRA